MSTLLFLVIAISGLVELAVGISMAVMRANHPLLAGIPDSFWTSVPAATGDFVCYFIALLGLGAAALHVQLWRCLVHEREEAHALLQGYGAFCLVGGVLLYIAFRNGGPGVAFLIVDSLRGFVLVATSLVVSLSPSTVSELRLPQVVGSRVTRGDRERPGRGRVSRRRSDRGGGRADSSSRGGSGRGRSDRGGSDRRRPGGRRGEGRGTPQPEEARSPGRSKEREDGRSSPRGVRRRGGRGRRRSGGAESPAAQETESVGGGVAQQTRDRREASEVRGRRSWDESDRDEEPRGDAYREEVGADRTEAGAGSGGESGRRPRRRGRRGSRSGSRERNGSERGERGARGDRAERGERSGRGERAERGKRSSRGDRAERGERGGRGDRAERGERSGHGDRAERGERGGRGDRAERRERDRAPALAPDNGSDDESQPFGVPLEYGGRRRKKGRYSTGALFRPPLKRSHKPLGGDLASEARAELLWPGDEDETGEKRSEAKPDDRRGPEASEREAERSAERDRDE